MPMYRSTSCLALTLLSYCLCSRCAAAQQTATATSKYRQQDSIESLHRDVSFVSPASILPGESTTTVSLRVVEAVNEFNGIRLRHRSYNGGLVGPTIRVRPGQKLRIRLENDLPDGITRTHGGNVPHGFNTTNLHTHGLHVSPESPADNVFLEVRPGEAFDFEFDLGETHPAGTFWYHPHKHGSTGLQLASGMAGALIVEGGLDDIPEIKAAAERILVLQQFLYREEDGAPATIDADQLYSEKGENVVAVNGVVTPTIVMRPGEVQRWRIVHGGTTEAIFLDAEGVNFCEIAVDGLATGRMEPKGTLQLYPGYRSDVLVKAPLREGTRLVYTQVRDASKTIRGRADERKNVLRLIVEGPPLDMPLPDDKSLAAAAAFGDSDVPTDVEVAGRQRTLVFSQQGNSFFIDGKPFDPNCIAHAIDLGSAEEWLLKSESGVHPFHVHVNPFAVKPDSPDSAWVWRDTIVLRPRRDVVIRARYQTFTGKTVLHCHNLVHEDRGMMQAIEIKERAENDGDDESALAPRWSASDLAGRQWDSRDYQGRRVLLVFHRGIECLHCARQLRTLADRIEALRGAGVEVVAISPFLPDGTDAADESAQFPFPLLIDPDLRCFEQFDCISPNNEPYHGLFLIDVDRRVLLERRTELAVADPVELVFEALKLREPGE